MEPATTLELLVALCPKTEQDVLMALRFLYYVKAAPVVPDARYDEAEKEFLSRAEIEDSPLMQPGSDQPGDYPDRVKALAFYLSVNGWDRGQAAGQSALAAASGCPPRHSEPVGKGRGAKRSATGATGMLF